MPTASSPTPRVALITGAARGIGAAIALRLADEGYDIALADLTVQTTALSEVSEQVQRKGRKTCMIHADVTKEDEVKMMVNQCVEELGGLYVMVANAGVAKFDPMLSTTVEDWDRLLAVNAKGAFLCYKHAAAYMIQQGKGGRIIGACSATGKRGAPFLAAYSAAKFAVRGLTQVSAQELHPHSITVNCYAPSFIKTELIAHPEDEQLGGRGGYIKKLYSLPKEVDLLAPDVVTELVSYLVKPAAQIVTGECISLDGTYTFD